MDYQPKRKDETFTDVTIMSNSGMDVWVATMVRWLVEKEKHGGLRQKVFGNKSARMVQTATT